MAAPTRPVDFPGDVYIAGNLTAVGMTVPNSSISNASVAAAAGIAATKLQRMVKGFFSQPNVAATAERKAVHIGEHANGTTLLFWAGSIGIATGNSVATVDLLKNGVTVLTAPITLDDANTNRVSEAATISVPTYTAGDLFEVVTTVTPGTGTLPTGIFAQASFTEDSQ